MPGDWLTRLSVTPWMAPVTVLVVLLKGTPSTVRLALVPPAGVAKVRVVLVLLLTASAPVVPVFWL